ncbi:MAG: DUF370 domain-containing protein [Lachnospiraceae bacterium]|nr:DUF370 domain-containing protein [Lachnospiraceae bacterium]
MNGLMNVGFGNLVNTGKILSIVSSDSAPAKRLVASAKKDDRLVDATSGRKTKSVICMEENKVVISALTTDTLLARSREQK